MHEKSTDVLAVALVRAARVMVGVSTDSLREAGDVVTLTQFRTLVVLDGQAVLNQVGLAARLDVDASTALRMVDKLAGVGLVSRVPSPTSRREVTLSLTDAGQSLVDRVVARRRHALGAIARRMPPEIRESFLVALESFSEAAGEPALADREAVLWEL